MDVKNKRNDHFSEDDPPAEQKSEPKSFPILVAEDHPVSRQLIAATLERAGHDVTLVKNGREAFDLFQQKFFPIILSDWIMPEMDGLELCRAVRSTQCPGYVFIILLTCRDSKEDTIAGLEAGADDYLPKPFDPGELNARIKTGIRILELERSLREANEEIRKLTFTDPLTRCFNRRYINDRLTEDIQRAIRYHHPLSLMMCDIDHFKKVNDLYGHRVGDMVLQEFVKCIQDSIRNNVDWLGRYGGEEFVLVLPETNFEGAQTLAERLRIRISRLKVCFNKIEIQITVSFGVAGFETGALDKNSTADSLLAEADSLLYKAKYHGRNQIQSANIKPTE